jgi:transposase-like protein
MGRFGLSHRDVEELLGGRGVEVGHITLYPRVQRFSAPTPGCA